MPSSERAIERTGHRAIGKQLGTTQVGKAASGRLHCRRGAGATKDDAY
ncbi:MAG TPA: hypothetical protein VFU86_16895 [Terriglobales bacterium]|nr:hypothetical protein [Terriglobales bacterium]